jgi:hypothetical protein
MAKDVRKPIMLTVWMKKYMEALLDICKTEELR